MAKGSTLYRFRISLSDVERSIYEDLDFRVAMHSSESEPFLLTRVLAYALNFEPGLEFSQGLSVPDDPAIRLPGPQGGIEKWIDIGSPTARRLHKASKAARAVRVYTYKDPEILKREVNGAEIHRAADIEIFSIESSLLDSLAGILARDNVWAIINNEGELIVMSGEQTWISRLRVHRLGGQSG